MAEHRVTSLSKKNDSGVISDGTTGSVYVRVAEIIAMNAGDYVEAYVFNKDGTSFYGNSNYTRFSGALINGLGAPGSGGGATDLGGLTDVALSSPQNGQRLVYDGSKWVNAAAASGDRITSGTLSVTANGTSGMVSLTTGGTTWGYRQHGQLPAAADRWAGECQQRQHHHGADCQRHHGGYVRQRPCRGVALQQRQHHLGIVHRQ
jgi:hypothetical protein